MGHPGPRNLSCVSYKHPSVRGGLGGAGGARARPVRCPPGQCCIGIWNQSQALVQGETPGMGWGGGSRGGPGASAAPAGCWGGGGASCPSPLCAPSPAGPPGGAVLVCLCRGHLCNGSGNGSAARPALGGAGTEQPPSPGQGHAGPLWLWGAAPLLILLTCLCVIGRDGGHMGHSPPLPLCAQWGGHGGSPWGGPCAPHIPVPGLRRARTHSGRRPRGGSGAPPYPPSPELPALRFLKVLQRGRFSAVWAGSLRHRPVAIKAFAARGAARFAAERAVHALPLMEHENVARLLGARSAGPRAGGGLLVLQLYPAGSLRHFLAHHVGSWAGTVRLALSLARGLAFLHQELWRDGLYKPSVVHRDLSSQNVLVRDDGTCAIGDFGLALALPPRAQGGAAAPRGGPIRKAGTQRYLAPEILDESLDLRAWGRALLQADVYALALLLWEILTRCQALSPGAPVPAFRLAYEAELGSSPTGAQLRRCVDERRRPLIPPAWHRAPQGGPYLGVPVRGSLLGGSLLGGSLLGGSLFGGSPTRGPPLGSRSPGGALPELLEDCWDPDPEARLSAERALQRLQRLWDPRWAPPTLGCPLRVPPPHGVPPPVPPCAGQEGGEEDEEEDEEGSQEAQALFVLLLLQQRLRLRPPPGPCGHLLPWPPVTPPCPSRVPLPPGTVRVHGQS
ncbi:LOW QUALITY PROTEIN: anti-Muellerian hormone type-2 receptor [Amazona ochrocephala]